MSTGAGALFGSPNMNLNTWATPVTSGGSNQWMNYPALPNFNTGINPSTGAFSNAGKPGQYFQNTPGGKSDMGGNIFTAPTFDPAFTSQFYQMLSSLMGGQGGNLQGNLLSFLSGGPSSIPGASSLSQMAQTGNPISALPEWQAMLQAQQQNIAQNQANLKEQFAFGGNLQSSPFGTAMSNYMQQTTADQNALLAQLEQQAMESAMNRELQASTSLTGMAGAESQFLNQLFSGGATASPGLFEKHKGSLLGGIGSLLGGLGSFAGAASEAGGIGALFAGLI